MSEIFGGPPEFVDPTGVDELSLSGGCPLQRVGIATSGHRLGGRMAKDANADPNALGSPEPGGALALAVRPCRCVAVAFKSHDALRRIGPRLSMSLGVLPACGSPDTAIRAVPTVMIPPEARHG